MLHSTLFHTQELQQNFVTKESKNIASLSVGLCHANTFGASPAKHSRKLSSKADTVKTLIVANFFSKKMLT